MTFILVDKHASDFSCLMLNAPHSLQKCSGVGTDWVNSELYAN